VSQDRQEKLAAQAKRVLRAYLDLQDPPGTPVQPVPQGQLVQLVLLDKLGLLDPQAFKVYRAAAARVGVQVLQAPPGLQEA
jgi:hypothetical protein